MAQYARDEAGNVWEVDAQGQPVRLAQPAAPAAPQPMTIGTPDPAAQYAAPMAAANLQAAQAKAQTAPYDARTAAANASRAETEAAKAHRDLLAQQATASPEQQHRMAALANDEILAAVQKARGDLDRTGAAGGWARLPEMIQPQSAIDLSGSLNTIASRLTLDKLASLKQLSPTGASGLGSLTEREGALLRDSVAGLGQTQSPERLRENLAAVEKHYRNFMALTNGEDYRDPKVAQKYGIAAMPVSGQGDDVQLATGATRSEVDPALAGVNDHIRGMIGAGVPAAKIVEYMNSVEPGLGDKKAADVAAATRFRAQNPTVPLSRYPVSVDKREVPMSGLRQGFNRAAQSPIGAFAMQAGDAVTGGTLDNMMSNPALARAGMQAVAGENPKSALLGTLAGGATAGGVAELGAARAGATWAPRIADMLYGSLYGAGSSDEGSRLTGAIEGAGAGLGGGMFGRGLTRGAGRAATGVRDASAQYLRASGVPLTIGQAVSQSGRLGRYMKGREDRLAGYSGIGDTINAQRRGGLEAFNRAAIDEGLAPIGAQAANQTGEGAVETAGNAVSDAYQRALGGINLTRDRQFGLDMQAPTVAANRLPGEMGENARYTLAERVGRSFDPNGGLTGHNFQQAVRGLEGDARAVRSAAYGSDFGGIARDARGALEGMLDRQSPGSLPAYLDANAAYRNHAILADATSAAMNTDGLFTPAQLGQAARANAKKFTGKISAATTDRPFFELQRAGQRILPSKVPDSGTAGRVAQDGGLTSTLRAGARNLFNAPLYAEGLQPTINRMLLDRPNVAVRIGEEAIRRARLGGLFGRPLALEYGPTAVAPAY